MRVVLTRPEQEAVRWTEDLRARGHDVLQLPLIAIEPVADPRPLASAWERLHGFAAVMFVSANAVRHFFGVAPGRAWPPSASAWSTGPGTAAALLEAGVPAAQLRTPPADSPQFDSEALWSLVRPQLRRGDAVLLVRGADAEGRPAGRDWLSQQLQAQGAQVEALAAYRRALPRWGEAERAQAMQAAGDGSVWLFSSSEAVGHLLQLVPGTRWSAARAVATHGRIAEAARDAGFAVVCLSRPSVDDVARALESIR